MPVCGSASSTHTRRCYSESHDNDGYEAYRRYNSCVNDPFSYDFLPFPVNYQGSSKAEGCAIEDIDGSESHKFYTV